MRASQPGAVALQALRHLWARHHAGGSCAPAAGAFDVLSGPPAWVARGSECSCSGRDHDRSPGSARGYTSAAPQAHPLNGSPARASAAMASNGGGGGGMLEEAQPPRPWHWVPDPQALSDSAIVPTGSADLGAGDTGSYYAFDPKLVPEALRPFHQAFYPPRPPHLQRRGGCRGLQAELEATGAPHLMWRAATQALADALDSPPAPAAAGGGKEARGARVLLCGPAGTGKSVALAQLVERERARGGLALYVPDARSLVSGGFFYRRGGGGGGDGGPPGGGGGRVLYDTILSAQLLLKSALDAHRDALAALQAAGPPPAGVGGGGGGGGGGGVTLLDVVNAGLSTDDDARLAVECCLALVRGLAAAAAAPGGPAVLFAVDGYGALHGPTDYGAPEVREAPGGGRYLVRRRLAVEQLALASGMRLLRRRDLGAARVVAATSATGGLSRATRVPLRGGTLLFDMPRFSLAEVAHMLHYYHERGLAEPPSVAAAEKLRAITNGSGSELRRLALRAAQLETNAL